MPSILVAVAAAILRDRPREAAKILADPQMVGVGAVEDHDGQPRAFGAYRPVSSKVRFGVVQSRRSDSQSFSCEMTATVSGIAGRQMNDVAACSQPNASTC